MIANSLGQLQIVLDDLDRQVPAELAEAQTRLHRELLLSLLRSAREQLQQTEAMAQSAVDAA